MVLFLSSGVLRAPGRVQLRGPCIEYRYHVAVQQPICFPATRQKNSRMRPSLLNAPLNALRAFEAAARHLSFKNAAAELHVTAGAVSHQVKLLEDYLGVMLFRRLTRALELTPEAQAMLPKLREGLEAFHAAVDRVRTRDGACALTVVAPPNFAARWLMPRLGRFTAANPDLELHVASRQSMVDGAPAKAPAAESEAAPDTPIAMVRFGSGDYPGAKVDEVFSAAYVPVCSPRLMQGEHPL